MPTRWSGPEEYLWLEGDWPEEELEEIWREHIPRWTDNAVGGHEIVDTLPPEWRVQKIDDYRRTLEHARRMLEVLRADE